MNDFPEHSAYPAVNVQVNHVEPVPRRIRATLAGQTVLDTTRARYVWEVPYYPQYYIPLDDIRADLLVPEESEPEQSKPQQSQGDGTEESPRGRVQRCALRVGDTHRPGAARVLRESPIAGLSGTARFEWDALDAWFEEDEQVHVHPRSPYVRVDALRSTRTLRVERSGTVLAESSSPVMVFETGLPTRYYLNRTDVDFTHLLPSDTVTACPYKGTTSGYWSARIGERLHPDLAWCYDFPTYQLAPITGLIAFYNERVDLFLDGHRLERPKN
ncbi:DUF427 domain-containing protein [Kitasatospora kifunensis]|uniref:Uncharacterized protein (DUF427 family) n=1 Tax=Kitasatospora kifunensis TaxID=58351 RepID=A0A7W7QZ38_KITKI|nr:DUF427 domain-containing protein [Kitasatospora kifunensis]MBB4922473.1 uncharacterized protein (DUF427 family) [Kitasatospora kifunensis]